MRMQSVGPMRLLNQRWFHSIRTPDISQVPDFSHYSPIKPVNEELAPFVHDIMQAYQPRSKHVNQQHYYHNRTVLLDDYLQKSPHPMSLMQLAQYYDDSTKLTKLKIINSGRFVKEELSIRIAHQINKLQQLPFSVVNNFHFVQVYESYYNIFERFRKYPKIDTIEDTYEFTKFLYLILQDFNSLNLPHMIMGALECIVLDLYPQDEMDELLSELLRARISRRLIVEEHIGITSNYFSGKQENTLVLGDIFQKCEAKKYLLAASKLCENSIKRMFDKNMQMPELVIEGVTDLKFYFLPAHLKYLLSEILRNSYEATIKEYIRKGLPKPDPIVVTIIENEDSYLFRISDKGGGLSQNDQNIWSFGKSKELASESLDNFHKLPGLQTVSIYDHIYHENETSRSRRLVKSLYQNTALGQMSQSNLTKGIFKFEKPLAGLLERPIRYKLGIGLATCKVYADYWNGDLTLHSIPSYGTDTVLRLGNLMKNTTKLQLDKV
ncbi:hypothetical protein Kpol_461p7 [Vanderwaltozyma polyspora DSM 70294]|uniref:Protein-serine/threonine kinase n=1 Tax=Vanderwaltozyma polyspora (strain ATCC 22028 / DSM 70294 / BCRC 21397 / CBS 2163 / NBRC 10782 / NRRL Y-8283 / UCD 57-17) TaxID=436907 RepID=A7TR43_VANPO|nr:uncharacterized protein Kpol_461p7 [Vanderwaltozyma polyspora DSM 70294]EDO15253.1 hypothetical protein Kpol_461p7 [Vanderwaltozyma polyspora DSM 70294]